MGAACISNRQTDDDERYETNSPIPKKKVKQKLLSNDNGYTDKQENAIISDAYSEVDSDEEEDEKNDKKPAIALVKSISEKIVEIVDNKNTYQSLDVSDQEENSLSLEKDVSAAQDLLKNDLPKERIEQFVKERENYLRSNRYSPMLSFSNIRMVIKELIVLKQPDFSLREINKLLRKYKTFEPVLYEILLEKYSYNKYVSEEDKMANLRTPSLTEEYTLQKVLGSGAYAVVKLCKRRLDNKYFACKIINKKRLTDMELHGLQIEIKVMKSLKEHENIVSCYDVFESRNKLAIILGLLKGGELLDCVLEHHKIFTEALISKMFAQLISALEYMHKRHIVHRDIKPDNLMLTENDPRSALLEVVDFGLSESCKKANLAEFAGTPVYMAPEIYREIPYDTKVDMWSAGCILYILFAGYPPFDFNESESLEQLKYDITHEDVWMNGKCWDNVSKDGKSLCRRLLNKDPKCRPSATEVLEDPWMKTAADTLLSHQTLDRIRKFQCVKRFKKGVNVMIAVIKLVEVLKSLVVDDDDDEKDAEIDAEIIDAGTLKTDVETVDEKDIEEVEALLKEDESSVVDEEIANASELKDDSSLNENVESVQLKDGKVDDSFLNSEEGKELADQQVSILENLNELNEKVEKLENNAI